MKNFTIVAMIAIAAIAGALAYGVFNLQADGRRSYLDLSRENEELKSVLAARNARTDAFTSVLSAKNKRIKELEERLAGLEKNALATYFLKKSSSAATLSDGTFEQKIELEPRGGNTIPLLSVIAQTRDDTRIIDIKVEGKTIPAKAERENNSSGTVTRVMYGMVRPGPVNITVHAEKETELDIIIDPFREI